MIRSVAIQLRPLLFGFQYSGVTLAFSFSLFVLASGRNARIELNYRLSITAIYQTASLPVPEATTTVYEFTIGWVTAFRALVRRKSASVAESNVPSHSIFVQNRFLFPLAVFFTTFTSFGYTIIRHHTFLTVRGLSFAEIA